MDNKWTIRLTQGLPFRVEVANPPNSGATKKPVASIVDSQHSATLRTTDFSVPFNGWKSDYAVIARMDDATSIVPVLIEAGWGTRVRSLAASCSLQVVCRGISSASHRAKSRGISRLSSRQKQKSSTQSPVRRTCFVWHAGEITAQTNAGSFMRLGRSSPKSVCCNEQLGAMMYVRKKCWLEPYS
jgi:hypothetical protein